MKGLKQPLLIESQWHTKNIGLIIECGSLKVKDIRKNYLHYGNFKFRFPERGAKASRAQKRNVDNMIQKGWDAKSQSPENFSKTCLKL